LERSPVALPRENQVSRIGDRAFPFGWNEDGVGMEINKARSFRRENISVIGLSVDE
jgi:hypothetical protein